ncbi:hypothetical protein HS088_TW08G00359 [Tripterygium wilfordii]|uniref:Uncharacterized protein n=1 Tax=Tripterygium wilfordii TaxID=458696 RepID=A0A7J7DBP0_TRIWF|nr:uncharacterized protein LOC120004448 [Tripterygium wilfordii]KAF5743772.1 hypothetical protein HS088_TW08G00359 [Tripterygium wilfordii]
MACPANSIRYNATMCACPPGNLLNRTTNSCALFTGNSTILIESGDYEAVSFPETIFSFDSIKKLTQSQAVFLEATLVMLLSWLVFCFFLRFMDIGEGRSIWFRLRWWISRLDFCFATRHWLDDQKVVVKRKTELGGTFSVASWILFIGLFAALLYQIIMKRTIEVHNVRATNAPDLASFNNDMEFNITTISSMSCSSLRDLGTLVTGNPGSIDYRVSPLADFVNYDCLNTSMGPTITFKCSNCQLNHDSTYISWHFIDLPNSPAAAVGFQFNLTMKGHANNRKHVSFVSGMLKNGSTFGDRPVTFRGPETNLLKFNLFPRIYHNLHDLRLIQPLFHDFLPGSFVHETSQLQASLQSSTAGIVNTTLCINYLSSYVIEVKKQNIMGPVSFLADLGGLYCISISIFLYLLVQCEFRLKKLRNEDSNLRNIRNRRKAQEHWDKLRKYVMYTWGCSKMDLESKSTKKGSGCSDFMIQSFHRNGLPNGNGSSRKQRLQIKMDSINFNRSVGLPLKKIATQETQTQGVKSLSAGTESERRLSDAMGHQHLKREMLDSTNDGMQQSIASCEGDASQIPACSLTDDLVPLPPPLELKPSSEVGINDIQKNLQNLYDYNVMLREKLVATQSLVRAMASHSSAPFKETKT